MPALSCDLLQVLTSVRFFFFPPPSAMLGMNCQEHTESGDRKSSVLA